MEKGTLDAIGSFVTNVGILGAITIGCLWIAYRLGTKLVDGMLKALESVAADVKTQGPLLAKLCENQERLAERLDHVCQAERAKRHP